MLFQYPARCLKYTCHVLGPRSSVKLSHVWCRWYSDRAQEPYTQGQSPSPGIREYFFYVDHNGMLFQVEFNHFDIDVNWCSQDLLNAHFF